MRERENDGQLIRHTDDRGWKWSMLLQNKLRFWPLSVCCMCAYRDWFIIEKFKVISADILHSCFGWLSHWGFCSRSHLNSGSAWVKHFMKSLSFIMTCLIVSSPVCLSVCLRVFSHPLLQRWERWLRAFLRPADSGSFPVPLPTRLQTRCGRETLQMWVWPHWYSTAGLSHEHYRFMMVACVTDVCQ